MSKNPHQAFQKGDLVRLADVFPDCMSHFGGRGSQAIVIGSYSDQYGGMDDDTDPGYTLFIEGRGESSWYQQSLLTLIEKSRIDLLDVWKNAAEEERKQLRDLDQIFAKEYAGLEDFNTVSAQALADVMEMGSLWGSRGEMYTLMQNTNILFTLTLPFLRHKDKAGFMVFAAEFKVSKEETIKKHVERYTPEFYQAEETAQPG